MVPAMRALITPKRVLKTLAAVALFTASILAARQNDTAREVMGSAFTGLFGFFTTPFILELSVAVIGLIAVISYNQWRISQEGDGWVILPDTEPTSDHAPETAAPASEKDASA